MKKITLFLSSIILAAAFCLAGCTTETAGSSWRDGKDGRDGQDGIGILWKGSWDYPPDNPELNWAYYNTQDRTSYIFDGNSWQILAEGGEQGISISWLGERSEAPSNPELNWAYYNTTDKKSYIFDGYDWQILAKDGEDGVSIKWVGEFSEHPYNPETGTAKKGWAYYNTAEKKTYLYDGLNWQILARDGNKGAGDGSDEQNGVGIVWKGELDEAPYDDETGSPKLNWAYYDTNEKKSYIYDGSNWQILAKDGKDADTWTIGGDDYWYLNGNKTDYKSKGADGKDGDDGISIVWKGSFSDAPSDPMADWAYYNTSDRKSYIYDGSTWQILAQDGQDVTQDIHVPSYTVIFAANGGKGYMPNMICEIGKTYDVPECKFIAPTAMGFQYWDLLQGENSFLNLSETDGEIIIFTAQWYDLPEYGLALNGNIVLDYVEYPNTSFVQVMNSVVTVTGSDDNWSSYVSDEYDDSYKGVFIAGRNVQLSPYSMGKYQVTQALYTAVMNTNLNYEYGKSDTHPAYWVSWYNAIIFCNKLSLLMGKTPCYTVSGIDDWAEVAHFFSAPSPIEAWNAATVDMSANGYRLPTEAEWEFAARGGNPNVADWKFAFSGIDVAGGNKIYDRSSNHYLLADANLATVGWYSTTTYTHPVGEKTANRLGLYDMSGNVREWCWDWYNDTVTSNDSSYIVSGIVTNPTGAASGSYRVVRGGSWCDSADFCCVSFRYCYNYHPYLSTHNVGFRLVCSGE